jgi:hypothetical protein
MGIGGLLMRVMSLLGLVVLFSLFGGLTVVICADQELCRTLGEEAFRRS